MRFTCNEKLNWQGLLPVNYTGGNKNGIHIQKYLYQFISKRREQVHQFFQGDRF
jgi:hypothetical protein